MHSVVSEGNSVSDRPTFSGRHDFLPEKSGRHCEEIWKSFQKLQF
jgi:hypothetical protein